MGKVELAPFDKRFFDKSRSWLEDEEVNRLTDTGELPTESDRLKWFESLPSRMDYLIWGVAYDEEPIGACGLKNIQDSKAEYWGYIGEKTYWGKGLGNAMMRLVEKEASLKGIDVLYLKVLLSNERAFKLYTKRNYVVIGTDDAFCFMSKML